MKPPPYAALVAALTSPALAGSLVELQLDLNNVTVIASPSDVNTAFSGTLTVSTEEDSDLNAILVNGLTQTFAGELIQVDGEMRLDNGEIAGGFLHVVVANPDNTLVCYSAEIVPGVGGFAPFGTPGFLIDFLTEGGMFSRDEFAAFDVTPWRDTQPLSGSAITFQFEPVDGVDDDTDLDIFVVVNEEPASADLNRDGLIGSEDLGILLAAWGQMP